MATLDPKILEQAANQFSETRKQQNRAKSGGGNKTAGFNGRKASELRFKPSGDLADKKKNYRVGERRECTIRIIPWLDSETNPSPFRSVRLVEYGKFPAGASFADPAQVGQKSPFEPINKLLMSMNESELGEMFPNAAENEIKRLRYQFKPKDYPVIPIIVRGREEEGVYLWMLRSNITEEGTYDEILKYFLDPKLGNIADLEEGHDIQITAIKAKNGIPSIKLKIVDEPSAIYDKTDKEMTATYQKLLKEIPAITDAWVIFPYSFLARNLVEFTGLDYETLQLDPPAAELETRQAVASQRDSEEAPKKPSVQKTQLKKSTPPIKKTGKSVQEEDELDSLGDIDSALDDVQD